MASWRLWRVLMKVSVEAFAFTSRSCVVIVPPPPPPPPQAPLISTFQKKINNLKFVQFEYDLSSTL
jgi:hypothetical protein